MIKEQSERIHQQSSIRKMVCSAFVNMLEVDCLILIGCMYGFACVLLEVFRLLDSGFEVGGSLSPSITSSAANRKPMFKSTSSAMSMFVMTGRLGNKPWTIHSPAYPSIRSSISSTSCFVLSGEALVRMLTHHHAAGSDIPEIKTMTDGVITRKHLN